MRRFCAPLRFVRERRGDIVHKPTYKLLDCDLENNEQ